MRCSVFPIAAALLSVGVTAPALARVTTTFGLRSAADQSFEASLSSARRHVDVLVPGTPTSSLASTLLDLLGRGRKLRLLMVGAGIATTECMPCRDLARAGAEIKYMDMSSRHYFAITDGPRTRVSSGEKSGLFLRAGWAAKTGHNAVLAFRGEGETALAWQDEFNFLWEKSEARGDVKISRKRGGIRVPGYAPVIFSSANMQPVKHDGSWRLVPIHDVEKGAIQGFMAGAVAHAYSTVDYLAADGLNSDLYTAMAAALVRGARVRVILPQRELHSSRARAAKQLCSNPDVIGNNLRGACLAALGAAVSYAPDDQIRGTVSELVIDGRLVLIQTVPAAERAEFTTLGSQVALRDRAARPWLARFEHLFAAGVKPAVTSVSWRR